MSTHSQLLVVVPRLPYELTDEVVVELILVSLGYSPLAASSWDPYPTKELIKDIMNPGFFANQRRIHGSDYDPNDISRNLKLLKDLTIGLLNKAQGWKHFLPTLQIAHEDDESLKNLESSDKTFHMGVVYASHPGYPTFFIRLSEFHKYLLDEKKSEFLRISASLGCKSLSLIEGETSKSNITAKAGVDGLKEVDVSGKFETNSSAMHSFKLVANFEEPDKLPYVPEGLRWLNIEPLWQGMITSRLENWISSMLVEFSYDTDFDVDISLTSQIKKIGLKIGGSFHEQNKIRQTYQVDFFPRSCYDALLSAKK